MVSESKIQPIVLPYQWASGSKFWREFIDRMSQINRRSSNEPLQLESDAARIL